MNILAIDSSSVSASVALSQDDEIISEQFINSGLTHSQTLMPMIEKAISGKEKDIDLIAVTAGPGSFTGVRIGIASVKGLADALNKDCFPLSTLEVIAEPLRKEDALVCPLMDARCNQVYTALFYKGERLLKDDALLIDDLKEILSEERRKIIFIGDGAKLCYDKLSKDLSNLSIADEDIRLIHASSICRLAYSKMQKGEKTVKSDKLLPVYLRVPQAERELKKSNKDKGD